MWDLNGSGPCYPPLDRTASLKNCKMPRSIGNGEEAGGLTDGVDE